MEGGGFWTGFLTGDDAHVAGLDDLSLPMTQETLINHDLTFQAE